MLPNDFYVKVEDPKYLKHTLYSDTDSVYLCIPEDQNLSIEEKWNKSVEVSEEINQSIIKYLNDYVFKKANIDPKYNKTYFKTESLMGSIAFLPETKKYYAYQLLVDEGKFLEEPKIKYKNISIKSNLAKMSTILIQDMLDNVILNSEIEFNNKLNSLYGIINHWKEQYDKEISEFNFSNIGIPNKWGKAAQIINAMKVYNLITGYETFIPGSAGKYVYCKFKNPTLFATKNGDIDLKNLNSIAVPYEYDTEFLKKKMNDYGVIVDSKTHWEKCIFTTTCYKIIQMIKNNMLNT